MTRILSLSSSLFPLAFPSFSLLLSSISFPFFHLSLPFFPLCFLFPSSLFPFPSPSRVLLLFPFPSSPSLLPSPSFLPLQPLIPFPNSLILFPPPPLYLFPGSNQSSSSPRQQSHCLLLSKGRPLDQRILSHFPRFISPVARHCLYTSGYSMFAENNYSMTNGPSMPSIRPGLTGIL